MVEALQAEERADKWSERGCVFQGQIVIDRPDGMQGVLREYRDCNAQHNSLFNGFLSPRGGDYLVSFQAIFPDYDSGGLVKGLLDSLRIDPARL